MRRKLLPRRLVLFILLIASPLILWQWADYWLTARLVDCATSNGSADDLDKLLTVHSLLGLAVTVLALAAGATAYHRRLNRQIDRLVEACRNLAIKEPSLLPEHPGNLDELGRLSLAIQVMHEALRDHYELYSRFFDDAQDMFLYLNTAEWRVLDANMAFCRAVGRLKGEVLGRELGQLVELDQDLGSMIHLPGALISGQVRGGECPVKVEASLSWNRDSGSEPWAVGLILRDVTLRENLYAELLRKSAALELALAEMKSVEEMKDEFLTTLSHELKTPLVSLKGFLQLLLKQRVPAGEEQKYLEICWRNLGKLEKQINDLLSLARLSQAKEQYPLRAVDLSCLARACAENLTQAACERKLTMNYAQVPDQPIMVLGNEEKLGQLLDNLLWNAVKYNVEGGEIHLRLQVSDGRVRMSISDTGVGIGREHLARIFNRFYRAPISGTGRIEGLGIGLSLVQEIVKLHQGEIQVESEPGRGTTFHVDLQAASHVEPTPDLVG